VVGEEEEEVAVEEEEYIKMRHTIVINRPWDRLLKVYETYIWYIYMWTIVLNGWQNQILMLN
jgi:hypothetical protein